MSNLKLGLLDFGVRKTKYSSIGKILDVIEYAEHADKLGFSKFWLAEHHNYSSTDAWSSPQMLLPIILNNTKNMNIGMSGVLINYYSSYEIALNFKLLANLFPNRVDLGFANGTPPLKVSQLLSQRRFKERPNTVAKKIKEISSFYFQEDEIAEKMKITIPPFKGLAPNLYMLSSSFNRTDTALDLKLNMSKSIFHIKECMNSQKEEILKFKEDFNQKYGYLPNISISFTGVCAKSIKKANKLADESSYKNFHNAIIGTPEMFQDTLLKHKDFFGVDEYIFHDATSKNKDRIKSLNKLSDLLKLKKA